jgi:hypothetical protein
MSLTEPDLQISHIRLFSRVHRTGESVLRLWIIRGVGSG